MADKKIDFESYLQEQHAEQYIGVKDLMIDDFNAWLEGLDIDEWIELGDKFGQELLKRK